MEKELFYLIIFSAVFMTLFFLSIWCIEKFMLKKNKNGGIQIGGNEYIDYSKYKEPYRSGVKGERKAFLFIKNIIRKDEYLLTNVLIPISKDNVSEIDCIVISRKGLFCIEIKNWNGIIKGSEQDYHWYLARFDRKNIFEERYNPVKQNQKHCDILEELFEFKYPVDNIVIFSDLDNLKRIISKHTFRLSDFQYCFNGLEDDQLTKTQVDEVCLKLSSYVKNDYLTTENVY